MEQQPTQAKSKFAPAEAYPDVVVTEEDATTSPVKTQYENVDSAYITLPAIETTAIASYSATELTPSMNDPIPERFIRENNKAEGAVRRNYDHAAQTIGEVMEKAVKSNEFFETKAEIDAQAEAARHAESQRHIERVKEAAINDVMKQIDRMHKEAEEIHNNRNANTEALVKTIDKKYRDDKRSFGNLQRIIADRVNVLDKLVSSRDEAERNDAALTAEYASLQADLSDAQAELKRLTEELAKYRGNRLELLSRESSLHSELRKEQAALDAEIEADLRKRMHQPEQGEVAPEVQNIINRQVQIARENSPELIRINGDIFEVEENKRFNQRDLDSYETLLKDKKKDVDNISRRLSALPGLIANEKANFVKASDEIAITERDMSESVATNAEAFRAINEGKATDYGTVFVGNGQKGSEVEQPIHTVLVPNYNSMRALKGVLTKNTEIVKKAVEEQPTFDKEQLRAVLRRDDTDVVDLPDLDSILGESELNSNAPERSTKVRKGFWKSIGIMTGFVAPDAEYDTAQNSSVRAIEQ